MNWYKNYAYGYYSSDIKEANKFFSWKTLLIPSIMGLGAWIGLSSMDAYNTARNAKNDPSVITPLIEKAKQNGAPQELLESVENAVKEMNMQPQQNQLFFIDPSDNISKPSPSPYNASSQIQRHENVRTWAYDDRTGERIKPGQKVRGKHTIGIGFNLHRYDARKKIESLGLDYAKVFNGEQQITAEQAQKLFNDDVKYFTGVAQNFVSNYNEQPKQVQDMLVDLAFNLGSAGLGKMYRLRNAIQSKKYNLAAKALKQYRYSRQTGGRAKEHIKMLANLAKQPFPTVAAR